MQTAVEATQPDDLSVSSTNYLHVEAQPDWGYMRKRVEAQKAAELAEMKSNADGSQPKERWEIIERLVLLAATTCFVGSAAWLFFVKPDPIRVFSGYLLSILAFWTVWQMLYEDRLGTSEPVTRAERVMAAIWMVHRALAVGVVGLVALAVAILELTSMRPGSDLWSFGALIFLAVAAGWVAIFGAGRFKSMSDDRSVHNERVRRYKR
ncbi:MAG: hypothetical protein KKB08_21805 [Gammaproteobacteria bacterium]|nr:hypothetical protein [Gammaproteobacteria bacterium]MBU1819380.1 hypothetical protein [Gammaproteobacteria bacterium]